jgi:hypothetical protein
MHNERQKSYQKPGRRKRHGCSFNVGRTGIFVTFGCDNLPPVIKELKLQPDPFKMGMIGTNYENIRQIRSEEFSDRLLHSFLRSYRAENNY